MEKLLLKISYKTLSIVLFGMKLRPFLCSKHSTHILLFYLIFPCSSFC